MYSVGIRNLIVEGVHGVTHKERQHSQKFQLEILAEIDSSLPAEDNIEEAVDYRVIRKEVERIVREERWNLLETLARRIGTAILLKEPRIRTVTLSIEKLEIWPNGIPGVTVQLVRP
jgi:7,8-dihydroneopterin aldolase/epimerase/oxygenase